jgi:hypothetical protein
MPTKTSSKPGASKRKSKPKLDGAVMVEAPVVKTAPTPPTHEDIAFRAFELSLLRTPGEGGPLNDWLAAERELRAS